MASDSQFDAALDLLRRLSPLHVSSNLDKLTTLAPNLTEDLLSSVDQPLSVRQCKSTKRDYLLCDYNRDGDSYRSPWSNTFDPPISDPDGSVLPSERVRKLEVQANDAFEVYRQMYYSEGQGASVGSVYFWDLDDGFAGVVLLKKTVGANSRIARQGTGAWDSIHVFEVDESSGARARQCHYKLTSTVILHLASGEKEEDGNMNLAGNMTRQAEGDFTVDGGDAGHVANIGRMVEDMEGKMRNLLQEVYFGKCKDIIGDLRSIQTLSEANRDKAVHRDVISSMGSK